MFVPIFHLPETLGLPYFFIALVTACHSHNLSIAVFVLQIAEY